MVFGLILPLAKDPGASTSFLMPMILVCAIWYLLLIRPQQKQRANRQRQVEALQKNDRILTMSGVFGTVTRIEDKQVVLRICDKTGTLMTITKSAIAGKVEPEASDQEEKKNTTS